MNRSWAGGGLLCYRKTIPWTQTDIISMRQRLQARRMEIILNQERTV